MSFIVLSRIIFFRKIIRHVKKARFPQKSQRMGINSHRLGQKSQRLGFSGKSRCFFLKPTAHPNRTSRFFLSNHGKIWRIAEKCVFLHLK